MSRVLLLFAIIALVAGCAGSRLAGRESTCGPMVATVINGTVAPKKPTGDPWDPPEQANSSGLLGLLAKGAMFYAGVASPVVTLVGTTISRATAAPKPASSPAPDPFVRFSVGQRRWFVPVQTKTNAPIWEYPLLLRSLKADDYVTISAIDADAGPKGLVEDPIGTTTMKAESLCKPGLHKLGPFGSMQELVIKTEPYGPAFQSKKTINVPGRAGWVKTGINVIQGQRLTITASGRACANGSQCAGPNGLPPPLFTGYNRLGGAAHCSLLVRIGQGKPLFVGTHRTVHAGGSGVLRFGVNDRDRANNSGGFVVKVHVE